MSKNLKRRCKRYGIDEEEYHKRMRKQKHKCKACRRKIGKGYLKDNIDHEHKKGFNNHKAVRGILCTNCNIALGHTRDDVIVLTRLINYLLNFKTKGCFSLIAASLSIYLVTTSSLGSYITYCKLVSQSRCNVISE